MYICIYVYIYDLDAEEVVEERGHEVVVQQDRAVPHLTRDKRILRSRP